MARHKLLEKQVRKYFTPELLQDERMIAFLNAVNNSYEAYEKDQALSNHAFRISEQEYLEINMRLKAEINLKEQGLYTLNAVIRNLDDAADLNLDESGDDLIGSLTLLHNYIERRKKMEAELRRNEEKYRGIISNMNLGLLEVDKEDRIQFANNSFCDMSGYSFDELEGHRAAELFMKQEDRPAMQGKHAMRMQGISDAYEMEVTNKKGETRWWLISGAPRYNEVGAVIGSIGIHFDITHTKRLHRELLEARLLAEESARVKEAFLANMSHEIRTPMNAILGMGRQLSKTALDPKQQLYLDTINTAAENLLVVINDILDLSKIEAGKLAIEQIGFQLTDVVTRATRVMQFKAEEKGLRLETFVDESLSPILLGDPYRLNQVLLNLVSNAIKFTEKGSVTIDCQVVEKRPDHELVRIQVTDTGIGMEEAFLQILFGKFLQEGRTGMRKYGGTGLGMSITKHLIELMQGTIEVKSSKLQGTAITLYIPFKPGRESDLPAREELVFDINLLRDKRILLVEDNEMNRLVATTVLSNYGARVEEAVNGVEAVAAVNRERYDLVLMDVQMPEMDGLEATRIIRKRVGKELPIIALTANAIKGENDKCVAAGMNDYLSKPFEEDELIKVIVNCLGKEGHVETPVDPSSLYSLRKLEELSHGHDGFTRKMVQLFLNEVPPAVATIGEAYPLLDFETVQKLAHRIKPVLGNLCITSLKEEIRDIERLAAARETSVYMERCIRKLESVIGLVSADLARYLDEKSSPVKASH